MVALWWKEEEGPHVLGMCVSFVGSGPFPPPECDLAVCPLHSIRTVVQRYSRTGFQPI